MAELNSFFLKKIERCRKDIFDAEAAHAAADDPWWRKHFMGVASQYRHDLIVAEADLAAANKAAQFAAQLELSTCINAVAGCRLVLPGGNSPSRPGVHAGQHWLCSPLFVARRYRNSNQFITEVRLLTPDNSWVPVGIAAGILNDHGAKLRECLLRAGANIAVETPLRRELLKFILNCPSAEELKDSFDLPEWLQQLGGAK
jgi:hypothetical protein